MDKVLLVGLGDIGEIILEQLVRVPEALNICVADRNEEEFMPKVYSAISGAIQYGSNPKVGFAELDVNDINATVELLKRVEPDLIVSAVALKTWWAPQTLLPKELFMKLDEAGFGPWLPFHLTLVHKLMRAVKESGVESRVINCSFPDAVNAVLGKLGMAPTVGIGNCDLFLPWLRKIIADRFSVPVKEVVTYFVGHHFLCHALANYGSTCRCPSYLKTLILLGSRRQTA